MLASEAGELKPWTIVSQHGAAGQVAVWRLGRSKMEASHNNSLQPQGENDDRILADESHQQESELALAIFSSRTRAEEYQQLSSNDHPMSDLNSQVVQLDEPQLLQILIAGFRQGVRYAALDPGRETARQLFVLRDVLRAAQNRLRGQTGTQAN